MDSERNDGSIGFTIMCGFFLRLSLAFGAEKIFEFLTSRVVYGT